MLLTFGVHPAKKGLECVRNALPDILTEFPEVAYIVLGATHPNELRDHGEAYLSLELLNQKEMNGIEKNVIGSATGSPFVPVTAVYPSTFNAFSDCRTVDKDGAGEPESGIWSSGIRFA